MQTKNPRGAGRKPVPEEAKKNCHIQFLVTVQEKEKIILFLKNKGVKLREFVLKKIEE